MPRLVVINFRPHESRSIGCRAWYRQGSRSYTLKVSTMVFNCFKLFCEVTGLAWAV